MMTTKNPAARRPYARPTVVTVREEEILAELGPAQGYGQRDQSMPLDGEWVSKS
jgi:hypothetical protein